MYNIKIKNYYLFIIWRLLIAYILYTLCRITFIFYNFSILQPLDISQFFKILKGGLMFDNTAILYTNILYLFLSFIPLHFVMNNTYQKILKWLYVIVNFLALSINLADTVYFRFTMRRTSMTFFSEFTGDVHFFKIFINSIGLFWYIFLIGIAFLLILLYLSGSYKNCSSSCSSRGKVNRNNHRGYRYYLWQTTALLITAPLFIIGVRGGATRTMRPITLSNAGDYVNVAIHTQAVLNTPFSLIRTIGKARFTQQNYYPDYATANQIYSPIKNATGTSLENINDIIQLEPGAEIGKKRNIVILILESFAAENMHFINKNLDKNYTPFLDSLSKEGLLCREAFANGRKSIDAVPSILASVPSLITSFAVTPYSTDKLEGLPKILADEGYYTAFMHGAPNNSMGIRAVSSLCGIDNYFGKDQFADDSKFDGAWGIWDEYFLPFAAQTISTFKEPFMANLFTLSSHHPFKIPEQYKDLLPKGETPLQSTTAYTDMCLRNFFKIVSKKPWFKNTIFVITPDHATLFGIYPKYKTSLGSTAIPIIFYAPGYIKPGIYDQPAQQIDIMPTLLGLLNYNKPYFAFGRDLNRDTIQPFVINYGTNQFQLVRGDTLLVRDNSKLAGVYLYKRDSLLQHNLIDASKIDDATIIMQSNSISNKELLEKQNNYFKAVIQQYVNRLIENKMTPDK
jgi:phosphoglycerol transferase MdoB-like AlkP superfamily enzyme